MFFAPNMKYLRLCLVWHSLHTFAVYSVPDNNGRLQRKSSSEKSVRATSGFTHSRDHDVELRPCLQLCRSTSIPATIRLAADNPIPPQFVIDWRSSHIHLSSPHSPSISGALALTKTSSYIFRCYRHSSKLHSTAIFTNRTAFIYLAVFI